MMLDMKRTFDEIVLAHSTPDRAEQILANPFYQSLSSSFAGTQEYMAMEKLGQLKETGEWDLIVVDTPPTRSALDFLDAPQSLARFLDGRLLRLLVAPAKAGGRAYMKVLSAGVLTFTRMFTKIIGAQALQDLSQFVAALETMFGGFRQRAEETYRLLAAPGHGLRRGRLGARAGRAAGGVLLRRPAGRREDAAGRAGAEPGDPKRRPELPAERALAAPKSSKRRTPIRWPRPCSACTPSGWRWRRGRRRLAERFTRAHPEVAQAEITALAGDVHDLEGLRAVAAELAEGRSRSRRELTVAVRLRRRARPSASARAVSSRARQEATSGRRRSSARRSRSVIPPQTPNSTRLSRASARHSVRTTHPKQRVLARFCAAPWTKSSSGSVSRQAARVVQSLSVRVSHHQCRRGRWLVC